MNPSPLDSSISRRNFLGLAGSAAAGALLPMRVNAQTAPGGHVTLRNGHFELTLAPGRGLECTLIHLPSGTVLAKGPYFYSMGQPAFDRVSVDGATLSLVGATTSGIEVSHRFRVQPGIAWIEEEISLRNVGTEPVTAEPRCGFTLPAGPATLDGYTFTAVPFRREPGDNRGQYADYSLKQILHDKRISVLRGKMDWHTVFSEGVHQTGINVDPKYPLTFDVYASEGWALTNGKTGFLLTKHNPTAMEWSILDPLQTPEGGLSLRWGGAGIYCGDPEAPAALAPGESFRFGTTRVTAFEGDLSQGFYTFRREMESRGYRVPQGFNPPLHWNELYDNKLWWLPHGESSDPEMRQKLYRLKDMEEAASRAQAIGCEALYMDPGWDVSFASKIWDESRLGTLADFTELMRTRYNLKVSLHTPLSGWCDPTSYKFECCRLDKVGRRDRLSICGASRQYVEETDRRLDRLGRDGVTFFMFDGTAYNGPCWDAEHGHPVPSRRQDHVTATNLLARRVHEKHPDLLIEMHDQVLGPNPCRYVPIYLGYGDDPQSLSPAKGFDTVWAFELMWDPMRNLGEGNSICLYYYNLAYSQPLYLHIDLRTDNAEAVMFWWNASTCRHLGIGGTHRDPAVRDAQKKAVTAFIRLKPYFASGTFYGIDETTHVHRHPTSATAVINCFNLGPTPVEKEVRFNPATFGLPVGKSYRMSGTEFARAGDEYVGTLAIPAMGHRLVEIT